MKINETLYRSVTIGWGVFVAIATSAGMLIGLHTIPMPWGWSFTAVLGLWVIIMGVVINHVNKIMAKVEFVSEEEHFEAKI